MKIPPLNDKALATRKKLKDFLEARNGKPVAVSGMWTGDFVGEPVDVGVTGCEFAVDGSRVWLPYSERMVLKDA